MPKVKNIAAALPEAEQISAAFLAQLWKSGDTDLIVVLGPTASGKTRYAVRLAHELRELLAGACSGVEIISADSRQVYRRMDIGTGKDLCEYGDIPYHLIDIAEPGEQYNVYRFAEDFRRVWSEIIFSEWRTVREKVYQFLAHCERYADRSGDPRRPFARDTWEAAFAEWEKHAREWYPELFV